MVIRSLWNADNVGWLCLPSNGPAGGILMMWKKDIVELRDDLTSETTLSCLFINITSGKVWFFSGVYCRSNEIGCMLLWNELASCLNK